MTGPSERYLALVEEPEAELERRMLGGETPDPAALVGQLYRGCNRPAIARAVGLRKFTKGFFRRGDGTVGGYNLPTRQNAMHEEWQGKPDDARARRFGFYAVAPVDASSRDNRYLHALLLDYGRGENPVWDPSRLLRDYIVRIDRGSDALLLGKAYLAVGPGRVPIGFFLAERKGAPG